MRQDHPLEEDTRAAVAASIDASGREDATIGRGASISRAMIGNYRAQKHTITLARAVALAAHLGITVDQLAGAAPLPDRSPVLVDASERLRDAVEVQEGLLSELRDVAAQLAQLRDQAGGAAETG